MHESSSTHFSEANLTRLYYDKYENVYQKIRAMLDKQIDRISVEVKDRLGVIQRLREQTARVIVGQEKLVDRLLIGILCNGHVLIEGVPGLAKTLTVSTLAAAMQTTFQRIQFTPDLMPADLTGTLVYNPRTGDFTVKKGPIFHQIVLADEINRAPAKVQSALLEAMQERQVTIGETTFRLEEPFIVFATQNPIEQEGTYPLPEAQVDRFMLKVKVDYPSKADEREILRRMCGSSPGTSVEPVLTPREVIECRKVCDSVYLDEKIEEYILEVVQATRNPRECGTQIVDLVRYGASPRATIALGMASRAHAFLSGRAYVVPQDIKAIAHDVLRHRLILSYEAEAEEKTSDDIIRLILDSVKVP